MRQRINEAMIQWMVGVGSLTPPQVGATFWA